VRQFDGVFLKENPRSAQQVAMELETVHVLQNAFLVPPYRVLELEAPGSASSAKPGQFVHVRLAGGDQPILRRPFSIFKAEGTRLALLYKQVGRVTEAMQQLQAGDTLSLLGPLGNGFPLELRGAVPLLVAGGYGVAPLYFLARKLDRAGNVFIGGATAQAILCAQDFAELGWRVDVATEDGSQGTRGLVTGLLKTELAARFKEQRVQAYACGPNAMLAAVSALAIAGGWPAWLSFDRHMGCGVGACLACVHKVWRNGAAVWARVCKEGPVFEARDVVWDDPSSTAE
jgi:dihydroorotate dehydrogenase electron transfer subunit